MLAIRKGLGLYANLRPVAVNPKLLGASTLRPEVLAGVDMIVVRELTGGIYFGEKIRDGDRASDLCVYTVGEVERIVRVAARLARERKKKLTSVDKANVLETSRLWREVTTRVMRDEFPDVAVSAHAGRRLRDAPHPPARRLRRDRDRKHVRRHLSRRGVDAGRVDGDAALGLARDLQARAFS